MKGKSDKIIREALADMFGMLEYKVRNGAMTADDLTAILTALEAGGGVRATISDIAGFYGKKEVDVRGVIHRKYMPAPVRRVYYDFSSFRDVAPSSWCKKSDSQSTD